jgi:hypothetical protein
MENNNMDNTTSMDRDGVQTGKDSEIGRDSVRGGGDEVLPMMTAQPPAIQG